MNKKKVKANIIEFLSGIETFSLMFMKLLIWIFACSYLGTVSEKLGSYLFFTGVLYFFITLTKTIFEIKND